MPSDSLISIELMEDIGMQLGIAKATFNCPRHLSFSAIMARIRSMNSRAGGPFPKLIPPTSFGNRMDPYA